MSLKVDATRTTSGTVINTHHHQHHQHYHQFNRNSAPVSTAPLPHQLPAGQNNEGGGSSLTANSAPSVLSASELFTDEESSVVDFGETTAFAGTMDGDRGILGPVGYHSTGDGYFATAEGRHFATAINRSLRPNSNLPAAEAVVASAAAIAAVGLARDWPGSRRDKRRSGRGGLSSDGGSNRVAHYCGRVENVGGEIFQSGSVGHNPLGGLTSTPLPRRRRPATENNATTAVSCDGVCGDNISSGGEMVRIRPPRQDKLETGVVSARDGLRPRGLSGLPETAAGKIPATATRIDGVQEVPTIHPAHTKQGYRQKKFLKLASTGRKREDKSVLSTASSRGSAKRPKAGTASAPVRGLTAKELITAGNPMAAKAVVRGAATDSNNPGLIRTIGKAKKGPCMLTLTPLPLSPHPEEIPVQKCGKNTRNHSSNSWRRRGSRSKMMVWEPEAHGGLLGPGEIKILVC